MLTPNADEKRRSLRKMKAIATGAFLLMAVIFFLTEPLGTGTIFWVVRWDHVNAFAEASMVGALADWFAVVALFKHPLGIPIWHTAIIPRKKDEIGKNLGSFVETRLLSIENLTTEIGRFSASKAIVNFLATDENRRRAAGWLTDAIAAVIHALDDEKVERLLRDMMTTRLKEMNASRVLGGVLGLVTSSGKHHQLLDQALHQIADWLPTRRATVHEFIERSFERVLKWGSRLVPTSMVDRATDQTLSALIEILHQAAEDPNHPLRHDLSAKVEEWVERLKTDPEWIEKVNQWKNEAVDHPELRTFTADIWSRAKEWLVTDLETPDSTVRGYALGAVESLERKLNGDDELRATIDERLRSAAVSFLSSYHNEISKLIQRIIDAWDSEQLSRELELNLGRDLQYIRLNGTFIGGIVGLLIHIVR